jgi:hypothetical protein
MVGSRKVACRQMPNEYGWIVRSHDLNRLLDEPGQAYLSSENIFSRHIAREGPWGKPSPTMTTI